MAATSLANAPKDRDAIVRQVCAAIHNGATVHGTLAKLGIAPSTWYSWVAETDRRARPEHVEMYARARVAQAHAMADHALSIADGVDPQTMAEEEAVNAFEQDMASTNENGRLTEAQRALINSLRSNVIARDRMRLDARKWLTSKIAPKIYGEKVEHNYTGETVHEVRLTLGGAKPLPQEIAAAEVLPSLPSGSERDATYSSAEGESEPE